MLFPLIKTSGWDVSSVNTMTQAFANASSFNQDLNDWNVSRVKQMKRMFDGASSFNGAIGNWDTSSVKEMNVAFANASSSSIRTSATGMFHRLPDLDFCLMELLHCLMKIRD